MPKLKHVLFFLLVCAVFSFASKEKDFTVNVNESIRGDITLEFHLDNYTITSVTRKGDAYSKVSFKGGVFTNEKGAPVLPFKQFSFQLTNNTNVTASIVDAEYIEKEIDIAVEPSQGVIYRNQDPATIPHERGAVYSRDTFYPGQVIKLLEPFIIRNRRGVTLQVFPIQYNPMKKTIRIYTSLKIKVEQKVSSNAINVLTRKTATITPEMHSVYNDLFINYNRWDHEIEEDGDLLVIYTSRDASAITPYVTHKTNMGFTVHTKQVSTGANVKDTVMDAYDNNTNILYVQLVGDWADIQSDTGGGEDAPMDPMLGCVVGSDNFPDIIIGRFSAESAADVTVQVNKTVTYEQNPNQTWWPTGLGIGSGNGSGDGDDGEADFEHINVIKDNKLIPNQYSTVNEIYTNGSVTDVTNYVNAGLHVINYCGQGSTTAWGTTGFNTSNVSALTNGDKLPFIISVAPFNGKFDNGTCFAEAWLRKSGGGAVGALMATISQPWQPPMRGQDYMNDLLTGGYNYSTNPGTGTSTTEGRTTFGSIVFNGLVLMYSESSTGSDLNTIQTWTIFGDCALKVVVKGPSPAAPVLSSPTDGATGIAVDPALNWNASSGATSYKVQVATDAGFTNLVVDQSNITTTSYDVTGLSNNTQYYWRAKAANTNGSSPWSNEWDFTTIGVAIPAAPVLVSPANGATGIAVDPALTWNASLGAASYGVQVATDAGFTNLLVNQTSITATSHNATGLLNNIQYFWRVNAANTAGTSAWSDAWNFTTTGASPAVPVLVSPANDATGIAVDPTLTWNASSGAASYSVQVATDAGFNNLVINLPTFTATSYNATGLLNNTQYFWRVNATNANGTSAWAATWNFTTITGAIPTTPVLVSPANGATGIPVLPTLTWNASSGAASYGVQVATDAGFTNLLLNLANFTATLYNVTDLLNNTQYFWRVNATNAEGTSAWSEIWNFTVISTEILDTTIVEPDKETFVFSVNPTIVSDEYNNVNFYCFTKYKINAALIIFDALGNSVFVRYYEFEPSKGNYLFDSWDLKNKFGKKVGSGSYLALLKTIDKNGKIGIIKKIIGIKGSF